MGTMEFQNDLSAVALEMLLIVQPEKRKTVQRLQLDKQTESHASHQSQGKEICIDVAACKGGQCMQSQKH